MQLHACLQHPNVENISAILFFFYTVMIQTVNTSILDCSATALCIGQRKPKFYCRVSSEPLSSTTTDWFTGCLQTQQLHIAETTNSEQV